MAKHIGVAYCGGKMTCNGYSSPKKENIKNINNYINRPQDVVNDTDADAFVYTYYDVGDTAATAPSSVLYCIKSCCKPYMTCSYIDNGNVVSDSIITKNDNIWYKEITEKHIINFQQGSVESPSNIEKMYRGLDISNYFVRIISYSNNADLNAYRASIYSKRFDVLKAKIVNKGVSSSNVRSATTTNIGSTTITNASNTLNVDFIPYTDTLTNASTQALNNAQFSDSIVDITFKLGQNESSTSKLAEERINAINEKCGTSFALVTGNGDSHNVQIYTKKTVLSNTDKFVQTSGTNVTQAVFHFDNVSSTNDIPSATTEGMFSGNTALTSCEIPCQMRFISKDTFNGCSRLSSYTSNPNFIDTIGVNAFHDSGLVKASLGNYTILQEKAFSNCINLTTIEWNNDDTNSGVRCRVSEWKDSSHSGGYTIPQGVFSGCTSLSSTKMTSNGSTLGSITIPSGFTTIGRSAFEDCSAITAVNLNGVTRLEDRAFCKCTRIQRIDGMGAVEYIGNEVFQPSGTTSNTITIYGGFGAVKAIEDRAFIDKTLQSGGDAILDLPSIESIGISAFTNSRINGHLYITSPTSTTIGSSAFCQSFITDGGLKISGGSTTLGERCFYNSRMTGDCYIQNTSISSGVFSGVSVTNGNFSVSGCTLGYGNIFNNMYVGGNFELAHNGKVPDYICDGTRIGGECKVSATTIGSRAFENITASALTISANTINTYAFTNSSVSDSIVITANTISGYAFYNTSAKDVSMSATTGIGEYAFANASSLSSITIPNTVKSIGASVCQNCTSLTSITIPNSVSVISNNAFYGCRNATVLSIGTGVTSIGSSAFYGCSGLTSVNIPNNVTSIGNSAFYNCTGITSVTMGTNIGNIGNNAFTYCTSLSSITCNATTPPTLGSNVFYGASNLTTIYVPSANVEDYRAAAGWSNYTIQGI